MSAPRRAWPALALVGLAGCADEHRGVLDPHSPEAHRIASLFWTMLALASAVVVVVLVAMLAALRRRPHDRATAHDASGVGADRADAARRHDRVIVVAGVVLPSLVLAVVGVGTVVTTHALAGESGTVRIDIEAEQWWWRLSYPDAHVVSANEVHVPVGRRVELTLRSDDVIHSVWVPQLAGKVDVVPGQVNHMTFTAADPGEYRGQCAEFCGIAHAHMAFVVVAEPPDVFDAWLRRSAEPASGADDGLAARGRALFLDGSCAGCHAIAGTGARGTLGPDLTHFGSRQTIAALTLPNDDADLARWLAHTQDVKPGARMPQIDLSAADVDALVAYLRGLR